MIRSVFMLKVKPGATPEPLEALIRTSRTPMVEGRTISNGLDLGFRQGSFDFCQVTDIVDVEAYRRWDADPGHNRMREELVAPIREREERCQFEVPT